MSFVEGTDDDGLDGLGTPAGRTEPVHGGRVGSGRVGSSDS